MTDTPYRPIDCGRHDRLLDWATRRVRVEIVHRAGNGDGATLHDRIVDVYTERGAEYLRTAGGAVIRLDALVRVEDVSFEGS